MAELKAPRELFELQGAMGVLTTTPRDADHPVTSLGVAETQYI